MSSTDRSAPDPTPSSTPGPVDAHEEEGTAHAGDPHERGESGFRRLFSDGLSGLLDSGGAFRRGQEAVSEIAQGTKEEVVRRASAELKGFLDKLDASDLLGQVLEGMVMEVKTEIRFKRSPSGKLEPQLSPDTKVRTRSSGDRDEDHQEGDGEQD
ncbi:MAG: hypothetical protein V3V08_16985 [Nannocystaceae bacterium]